MGKVRLRWRNEGPRELRTSREVREDLLERAQRVAAAAGPGVEVLPVQEPRERAHLVVAPVDAEAETRVGSDNSLIKALDAGR